MGVEVLQIAGIHVSFSTDIDLKKLIPADKFETYQRFRLNLEAHKLSLLPAFDTLLSLNLSRGIIPFEHQINSVKKLLGRFRGRGMLCDEVGLGKTIEASLAMLELITRGLIKRVLILVPPSLIEQWKEETFFKFNLEFITSDDKEFKSQGSTAWRKFDRIIASIHTAKKTPHSDAIKQENFDLIIVDEAHHLKNANTVGWKFLNSLKKKYIFLLTATPVQNHLEELFNLVTLVYPGELGTLKSFKKNFVTAGDRLTPKNYEQLRSLLGELIIRNRRATSDVKFTKRYAKTIRIQLSEREKELYESISDMVRNQYTGSPQQVKMALRILQEEIGSTPPAAVSTLESLKDKLPDNALISDLIKQCSHLVFSDKVKVLIDVINKIPDKAIIFTKFRASHTTITTALGKYGIQYSPLHGGLTRHEKEKSIKEFESEINQLGEDLLAAKQKYSTLKDTEDKIFGDQFNTTAAETTVTEDSKDEYRDS